MPIKGCTHRRAGFSTIQCSQHLEFLEEVTRLMSTRALPALLLFLFACGRHAPITASPAPAVNPESVRHFSSRALDSIANVLHSQQPARVVGDYARYALVLVRRNAPGEMEVHDLWDDVFVVRSGSATLVVGSTFSGTRMTAPGERRGGIIGDPRTIQIRAGDVLTIPAGVAHQVIPAEGDTITYFVVKAPGAP